jgi:glutamate-1-semialdehyde 2,1-aminomutase
MKKNFKKKLVLYKKASTSMHGSVQLLSKKPEIFLPDQWLSYYKSAKSCKITTLDNLELYDFTNYSADICPHICANLLANKSQIDLIKNGTIQL